MRPSRFPGSARGHPRPRRCARGVVTTVCLWRMGFPLYNRANIAWFRCSSGKTRQRHGRRATRLCPGVHFGPNSAPEEVDISYPYAIISNRMVPPPANAMPLVAARSTTTRFKGRAIQGAVVIGTEAHQDSETGPSRQLQGLINTGLACFGLVGAAVFFASRLGAGVGTSGYHTTAAAVGTLLRSGVSRTRTRPPLPLPRPTLRPIPGPLWPTLALSTLSRTYRLRQHNATYLEVHTWVLYFHFFVGLLESKSGER